MRIVLLYNPLSGRGRAAGIAATSRAALAADGHAVREVEIGRAGGVTLSEALAWPDDHRRDGGADSPRGGADGLVIIGGDGTLHHALPAVLEHRTPVYHMPLGTENLFARQFGMRCDVGVLRRALGRASATASAAGPGVDVGLCNGTPFALMVSVGPDANVVHRLARTRRGRISHLSYVCPGVAEFLRPRIAPMTVEVDGRAVVRSQRGIVVVANSRQYALRIDPAARASMTDGRLDVVFMPCTSAAGVLWCAAMARARRLAAAGANGHAETRTGAEGNGRGGTGGVYAVGERIRVVMEGGPACFQIDGEAGCGPVAPPWASNGAGNGAGHGAGKPVPGLAESLELSILPGALRVLAPN